MRKLPVLLVALGALALRLWGINFGLPAIYRPDEDVVVGRAMGILHGVIDPHFANWPHLYMYVSAAWLEVLRPFFPLMGTAAPYLGVRLLDALLGTATVVVVYLLGRRAFGDRVGLIASIGLAVAFLAVRDSHFATIDTPLTLVCTLALYAAVRLTETDTPGRRGLAGLLLGLAASVKYNGALVISAIAAAQVINLRLTRRALLGLLTIVAIGIAAFAVTSPFLFVNLGSFKTAIGFIFEQLGTANQPEIGYLHIPRLALWNGLDPPLFLLSLAGIVVAILRRTAGDWVLLAFIAAYYALIGAGHTVFVRYADPLLPPLIMLGARALVEGAARFGRPLLLMAAGTVLVATPALFHDVSYDRLVQQTDTRTQAFDWMRTHLPNGARVATLYFAGPEHDQAMIDRRDRSHGATDNFVASFLQNRLQDQFSIYDLPEGDLRRDAVGELQSLGVDYIVYSATTPGTGCEAPEPLRTALDNRATLMVSFSPTGGRCPVSTFDPIDGYYVPLNGYAGWDRPGPAIRIYSLRLFPRLFAGTGARGRAPG